MESEILLSVVTPTFNASQMTKKSLTSLVCQPLTQGKFEILVIDNNSTDDTKEVVQEFCGKYDFVKYHFEPEQGLSFARNRGIKEARGEYILFVDGNKESGEKIIQYVMDAFLNNNPQPLSVGGRFIPIFEAKKPFWYDDDFEIRQWGKEERFLTSDEAYSGFGGGACAFKRDLLLELGGFNTKLGMKGNKLRAGEETDLYKRIFEAQSNNNNTLFYDPKIIAYIHVPKHRLTIEYRVRRAFGFGVSVRNNMPKRSLLKYLLSLPLPAVEIFPSARDIMKRPKKLSTRMAMVLFQASWWAGYYWAR